MLPDFTSLAPTSQQYNTPVCALQDDQLTSFDVFGRRRSLGWKHKKAAQSNRNLFKMCAFSRRICPPPFNECLTACFSPAQSVFIMIFKSPPLGCHVHRQFQLLAQNIAALCEIPLVGNVIDPVTCLQGLDDHPMDEEEEEEEEDGGDEEAGPA